MPDDAIERARARIEKYIREYEDAPSWGGPTMYPERPSIADLRSLLAFASQQAPEGWRPIDTAPKDGTYVMLYDDGMMRLGSYLSTGWEPAEIPIYVDEVGNRIVDRDLAMLRPGCSLGLSGFVYEPTHWRPLPAPPAMLDAAPSVTLGEVG